MATNVRFIPNPRVGTQWEQATETREMIQDVGEAVAAEAAAIAPKLTGRLASSIRSAPDSSGPARSEIGADVDYAAYVEFGTSDTPAQPFLRPALERVVGR